MASQQLTQSEPTFKTNFLGQNKAVGYSANALAYAVLGLRIVMGWTFLQAGLDKLLADDWSAAGFLQFGINENNPFKSMFADMAGSGLIDGLNMWGLTLVGVALILGVAVRWSAFWGAVMMLFYWAASLTGGLGEFLPLEHGYVVDDHIVYAILLFGLGAIGAGRIFGIDAWLEKTSFYQNNTWLRWLLG